MSGSSCMTTCCRRNPSRSIIKLKSDSPELVDLVMEPLEALLGKRSIPGLPGVTEESHITTTIFRHDRSLKARPMYFQAVVDSTDNREPDGP